MSTRCTAVPAPAVRAAGPVCSDAERSTYTFVWPSLVRGQALNGRRDPLDHDFVRVVDGRSWVGAGGCRRPGACSLDPHHRA